MEILNNNIKTKEDIILMANIITSHDKASILNLCLYYFLLVYTYFFLWFFFMIIKKNPPKKSPKKNKKICLSYSQEINH